MELRSSECSCARAYQVANGLSYLHRHGILHGDLKVLNTFSRQSPRTDESERNYFRLAVLLLSMLLLSDIVFAHDGFPVAAQPGNLLVTSGGIVKLADYAVLVGLKVRTGLANRP
jgi:serine/threonine protein kinase